MKKALIAMSGGVDSSVAAYLTKNMGYDCIGCTMKLYSNDDVLTTKTCCSLDDVEDARSVAYRLGMPHYVFNFSDDFNEKVIKKFVCSYLQALTPNPCIDCNRYMKFDKLYIRALELDCDKIVTGHYARIGFENGVYTLKKAVDESKDQSYVLYNLTQELLAHILFPLGELSKPETRALAEQNGFLNAEKPESQDICFVPDGDYASVIRRYLDKNHDLSQALEPGDFVSIKDGSVLGRHKGIIHYTIGQRRGLGISAPEPLYVCRICPENNSVILGSNDDLFSDTAYIKNVNWISGHAPEEPVRCKAKIRYRHKEQPATLIPLNYDAFIADIKNNFSIPGSIERMQVPDPDGYFAKLVFDEPQRAITPGQAAVFYDGENVIGGGTIV